MARDHYPGAAPDAAQLAGGRMVARDELEHGPSRSITLRDLVLDAFIEANSPASR